MDNIFSNKKEGQMYVGEVELGMKEMHEAIAAAQRLLGEHVYPGVSITGDQKQCTDFGRDVVMVATLLGKLTRALTDGKPVDMGEVN